MIKVPASVAKQGTLTLFVTSIKVKHLVVPGFYNVETLDPENENDKGYQRLLNKARAKKLAEYIENGQDTGDVFLPTSIFLATDKKLAYDADKNLLEISTEQIGAFSVVDGQHRLEGLKLAAESDPRVLEFDVPVNIASELPKIAQMCHFLIVNTTQKSVDKAVEQRIYARLTEALEVEEIPSLPKWILKIVRKGEVEKAVKFVDYLNEEPDSPWLGKIQMANSDHTGAINQRSFVKSLEKYVFTASNPLGFFRDPSKEMRVFLNYWKAICEIIDDGTASVLYKYNGVELFCRFSAVFFMRLQDRGSFTVATMKILLQECFDNLDGENAGIGHPSWWVPGGKASQMNSSAINFVFHEMTVALHSRTSIKSIEI